MDRLPFRQVHLDFHTSGLIEGIGAEFKKEEFQEALKLGHVNSVSLFYKCHHGYSYHPSHVNEMHPNLAFNLLGQQLEACKEIGVRAPIYISAGFDEKDAVAHPEWTLKAESNAGIDYLHNPKFHLMCFNTPYLDKLVAEVEEVMELFDPVEIFMDICAPRVCYCNYCIKSMLDSGLDPYNPADVKENAERVYANYAKRIEEAVHKYNPETAIFHNDGNIPMGRRHISAFDTHFELESLPTGGWGYDHFPMSTAYVRNLGKEYLGMTGKFHGHWGEFGGFKHPNALRYETALSIAMGAKCSIGDQLHANGKMNLSTYGLIGAAYAEVEEKEAWCHDVSPIADVAVLSLASEGGKTGWLSNDGDVGANRILLEGKYLYDFIDSVSDFSPYKLIILPDRIPAREGLTEKLQEYLKNGGKLLASGTSGIDAHGNFLGDESLRVTGDSQFNPTYLAPVNSDKYINGATEYIMYERATLLEADENYRVLAYMSDPYFNRTSMHFCSHHHAPNRKGSERAGVVCKDNVAFVAWDIFAEYAKIGSLHLKETVLALIEELIGEEKTLKVEGLPDRGVVNFLEQKEENRYIFHGLFAHTSLRGNGFEIIEDFVPVRDVKVTLRPEKTPSTVKLVPAGEEIPFTFADGRLTFVVPEILLHQMVEISY